MERNNFTNTDQVYEYLVNNREHITKFAARSIIKHPGSTRAKLDNGTVIHFRPRHQTEPEHVSLINGKVYEVRFSNSELDFTISYEEVAVVLEAFFDPDPEADAEDDSILGITKEINLPCPNIETPMYIAMGMENLRAWLESKQSK